MAYFLTVAQQVLVLFILIAVGAVLGKRGIMTDKTARLCSDLALLVATPCVIISSFRRESTPENWISLGVSLGAALFIHLLGIAIAHLLFRKRDDTGAVLRLSVVLSNAGFMGLPLQQAVLGELGVFYGAAYVVAFNLVYWSYGVLIMSKDGGRVPWKKILFSPGVIGLTVGVLVMLMPWDLPQVIASPLSHLGALNTPLPMLFIGYYLTKTDFAAALRRPSLLGVCAVRLLLVPIVAAAVLYAVGIRGVLLTSMIIAACAPVAAGVSMFAARFDRDNDAAVSLVSLSTVLSLATMPIIVSLIQLLPE